MIRSCSPTSQMIVLKPKLLNQMFLAHINMNIYSKCILFPVLNIKKKESSAFASPAWAE